MKKKEKTEWQRILSNPDNVIVSDWLLDQLDPADVAPEISNPRVVKINCEVRFEDHVINGSLISFAITTQEITCTLSFPVAELGASLFSDCLQRIQITTNTNDDVWTLEMLPEDEKASLVWSRESDHEALLSIVIKK
jgi:hypothetical protein